MTVGKTKKGLEAMVKDFMAVALVPLRNLRFALTVGCETKVNLFLLLKLLSSLLSVLLFLLLLLLVICILEIF